MERLCLSSDEDQPDAGPLEGDGLGPIVMSSATLCHWYKRRRQKSQEVDAPFPVGGVGEVVDKRIRSEGQTNMEARVSAR